MKKGHEVGEVKEISKDVVSWPSEYESFMLFTKCKQSASEPSATDQEGMGFEPADVSVEQRACKMVYSYGCQIEQ